jgi:SAM-dependent methyltransferase
MHALRLEGVPVVSPNVGSNAHELSTVVAPLDHYLCQGCGLLQLRHVVDENLLYRDYRYRTSISTGLADHFRSLADQVILRLALRPGTRVVELGSNDGTLLQFFQDAGMDVLGVDPATDIAAGATARGIHTFDRFFDAAFARELRTTYGPAKVVLSNNCMANIDRLDDVLRGVELLLDDDGLFVFETQYALDVIERFLIDVLYLEHISCFAVRPLTEGMLRFGLELVDVERIATKGGSIRVWAQKRAGPMAASARVAELITLERQSGLYELTHLESFNRKTERLRALVDQRLAPVARCGGEVAAYGSSIGCAALIHQLSLQHRLAYVLDDSPFKDLLRGPHYELPIYRGDTLVDRMPALVIVLAWRYAPQIVSAHREYVARGGQFYVPLPLGEA